MTPNLPDLTRIITTALAEDVGAGDITSALTIAEGAMAEAKFIAHEEMVVCGGFVIAEVYGQLDKNIKIEVRLKDGTLIKPGAVIATATGNARTLLTGERVALNILQRMSGVATLTRQYVEAVKGTKAKILDTRKTMPGLRALDKHAVTCGGGENHRMGLYDAVLVKDNHLGVRGQGSGVRGQGSGVREVVEEIKKKLSALTPDPRSLIPLIIECDTLAQVEEALTAQPDRILLDNMTLEQLREAVKLAAGKIPLEASGGVTLATVRGIAQTGVDYISVGAITHSAPAVDISLEITKVPS